MKNAFSQKRIAWLLLGLFFAFLAGWMFSFQGRLPAITDLFLNIYSDKVFNIDRFRLGFIPLWNPWIGCGTPQMASWLSSCFYPLFWVWNFLGTPNSLPMTCIFHSAVACIGTYLWLRCQKISFLSSALGAISFSGSALFVRCWSYPHHIATLTWIPWIFWSLKHSMTNDRRSFRWFFILFLCLQILSGYPIFIFYTWLVLGAWFFSFSPSGVSIIRFFTALFLAVALTTLQWLPFVEFLTYCGRGGWWKNFPYVDRAMDYLTLFDPTALGIPGSSDYRGENANFVFNLYFGLIPLGLFIWSWIPLRAKTSLNTFWKITALFFLVWMAGPHVLPNKALELLEPSKAVGLFLFSAVTSIAFQFQAELDSRQGHWSIYGLLVLVFFWGLDIGSVPFRMIFSAPNPYLDKQTKVETDQMRRWIGEKRMLSLLSPDLISFAGEDRFERSAKKPAHYLIPNANLVWGLRSADEYLSIWVKSEENLLRYTYKGYPFQGDLLEVAGVALVLLPQQLPVTRYLTLGKWDEDFINFDPNASENFRWVGKEITMPDAPSVLNRLARPNSHWREKVYLEKGSDGSYFGLSPLTRVLMPQENYPENLEDAGHFSRKAIFSGPGYGVFDETFAPGWHAWVDGEPQPIFRAYGLFMAVPIPTAGSHQVEFRYEPTSFRVGLFISLIALTFMLLSGGWALSQKFRFFPDPI